MPEADRWPGLASDASPHAGAARVSDNCRSLVVGTLSGRKGMRECWFENATPRDPTSGSNSTLTDLPNILALATLRRAEGDYCVYLNSLGELHAGRRPT